MEGGRKMKKYLDVLGRNRTLRNEGVAYICTKSDLRRQVIKYIDNKRLNYGSQFIFASKCRISMP
jgi:hypothetical protein